MPPTANELALAIYHAALDAVNGSRLVQNAVTRSADILFVHGEAIPLGDYRRILVAGSGKASIAMAEGLTAVLGDRIDSGLIVTKERTGNLPASVRILEGGHPVPDERSLAAGAEMLDFAAQADAGDLVIYLLSGGSSALLEALPEGVTLNELRSLTADMLRGGDDIRTINAMRRQHSRVKNGNLARAFAPATVVVLVLSDVTGSNPLATVGSGPFMPPEPVPGQPAAWDLRDLAPFPYVPHTVIGSVSLLVHAAADAARQRGLHVLAYSNPLQGEARRMTRTLLREAAYEYRRRDRPFCMIWGGETTVTVRGSGRGGRCQEMALAAAPRMRRFPNCAFLAAGTDGTDGPTEAAGGSVDAETCLHSTSLSWREAMRTNDSLRFLREAGGLIVTGPTGSNVNDLALFVSPE